MTITNEDMDLPYHRSPFLRTQKAQHFASHTVPIDIDRTQSRFGWCSQVLCMLQSTSSLHALTLLDIIFDRKGFEYVYGTTLSLCFDNNNPFEEDVYKEQEGTQAGPTTPLELAEKRRSQRKNLGITIQCVQRCRDVVCDLVDLLGMQCVLFEPDLQAQNVPTAQLKLSHQTGVGGACQSETPWLATSVEN